MKKESPHFFRGRNFGIKQVDNAQISTVKGLGVSSVNPSSSLSD